MKQSTRSSKPLRKKKRKKKPLDSTHPPLRGSKKVEVEESEHWVQVAVLPYQGGSEMQRWVKGELTASVTIMVGATCPISVSVYHEKRMAKAREVREAWARFAPKGYECNVVAMAVAKQGIVMEDEEDDG